MAGTLFVVATPIGNLEDITMRALEVLRNVHVIACEDTRKSRILLQRWGIRQRLLSFHKFSEARKMQLVLDRLEQGQNVAIVSDAGTPGIADPGARVVRAALDAGYKVVPIPGPSAVAAALSVSGVDCSTFHYLGFVPRKDEERRAFFETVAKSGYTSVFFETPHRIGQTLKIAADILGTRRISLMRELTKIHEETLTGTAAEILATLQQRETVKGEIVLVVEGGTPTVEVPDLQQIVETLMSEGFSGKRLANEAHQRYGVRKSQAYETFLEITSRGLHLRE
ncbi:16S rRNA (cytidine(1402)-2'-O)-methyltransferase [Desulfomonile tiedjei]|uniref:Ribosomal RNA small subunit methyltransferase I n=1 Tax=Desulfomonile tiedjei (strain ATCC 49306 / DSM 6799 / DCB-1) TaxID=706587 RepID=I4C106_DESTA|nr:16S rRNA (cytidine(1402)-2'-O)-methyltransferase [Desulfomonile tiedjei]AFM23247.1 putative S-adenosylmethionine-dependent methyltransferase, YraL family [Desulfomonile tiedjei DSM 6799]